MLSAFTLAALTWTGAVRVEYVILLAAFNGTVGSFDMPGRQSFVVEMVGYEDLANAIALNSMMFNSARMLGPAAAGLLIAYLGIGTCFFLNGVSFLAVIWSLTQMEIPARVIAGVGSRMLHQLREGLAYVWSNRPLFYQMALAAVTNGFGYQYLVLVPLFAKHVLHGDARTYGFLVAIQGLGSVVGAATLASRVSTRGMRNNLLVGLFLSALGIVVFGMSRSFALSLAAQFVIGAGLTNFRASNNTLVQMFVNDDLRGRVMSTYQLAAVGMTPIGALEVGYMGSHLGPMRTVVICGVVILTERRGAAHAAQVSRDGRGAFIIYSLPDAHFVCSMLANRSIWRSLLMKSWISNAAIAIAMLIALPVLAHADNWQIDPAHTNVEFTVRHMMISNVKGQFQKTSGTITTNGNDPTSAQINATIDATSIDTRVDKRDAHLKSPAFLDVDKFPTITFKSTKVEADGPGTWKVTGDLTLHGVTKPVVLEVESSGKPITDPMGNTRAGASATTKIKRSDFGLVWNKALEGGGVMVGDEVAISIDLEAIKK